MEEKMQEELKQKLLKEKKTAEMALAVISRKDTEDHVPGENDPKFPNFGDDKYPEMDDTSPNEIEEYMVNVSDTSELEARVKDIEAALEKLDGDDNYGYCEKCHESIDDARLQANPAARTCMNCAK